MFREAIRPVLATSLLTVAACSGGAEGVNTHSETPSTSEHIVPDSSNPETINPMPETLPFPETTPPSYIPETTAPDYNPEYKDPSMLPNDSNDDALQPIVEAQIGNVAFCDAIFGPGFAMADYVDEDPTDIEERYSSISAITYEGDSKDAEIYTFAIKGLGDMAYKVVTNDGLDHFINLNKVDVGSVDLGRTTMLAVPQSDGSVWFTTSCNVEVIEQSPPSPPPVFEPSPHGELTA